METTNLFFHICSRILRKILSLSPTAITNLINAMLGSNYHENSVITYTPTKPAYRKTNQLTDMIVTVNSADSYRIQAKMTDDGDIIFQAFEYTQNHPSQNPNAVFSLRFSELNFSELPAGEMNQQRMVCLIPFSLLRLRIAIEKERTPQNLEALKNLIRNDIICTIDENLQIGNITVDDARKLRKYTHMLYQHLYSHYDEMNELNNMTDELFLTDVDLFIHGF